MEERINEHKGNKRFYLGVILIAIGGVLILERLNIIPWSVADVLISWQMLLVVVGVFSLMAGNRTGGVILIGIGGFFLLPDLFTVSPQLKKLYWPLLLVAVGGALLYRQKGSTRQIHEGTKGKSFNEFDDIVVFGGREIFVDAQDLKGGRCTSIFGGIEYDMRQAKLSSQGAVIDCICVFGGTGIKVPLDWNVKNEITTIFGAFSDKRGDTFRQGYLDPEKTIVIKGLTIFGGVEIKHV